MKISVCGGGGEVKWVGEDPKANECCGHVLLHKVVWEFEDTVHNMYGSSKERGVIELYTSIRYSQIMVLIQQNSRIGKLTSASKYPASSVGSQ